MKIFKKYLSTIITLSILVVFGIYLFRNPEIVSQLLQINPIYMVLLILLYLLIIFVESLFILLTLNVFSKGISLKEGFYITLLSRIGNYLLPMRAGAIFRATYLKKKYNFKYTNFLSTLYGYYIIFFLTNSLLALVVLLLKWRLYSQVHTPLTIFLLSVSLSMFFLVFFRIPFQKILQKGGDIFKKIGNLSNNFISGWRLILRKKGLFLKLIILATLNILLNIVVVYIEFLSIDVVGNILDTTLYTTLSGLSLLISITPGSLGIREGIFLLTSNSIGLTEHEIFQIAILDRGVMFVLLLSSLLFISLFVKDFNLKEVYFGKKEKA